MGNHSPDSPPLLGLDGLRYMKEKELREAATCGLCNEKIGKSGLPLFMRVSVKRYGLKADALRRQTGFGMLMGNGALAQIMGPNEDMAEIISENTVTVCETCGLENSILHRILEKE